MNTKVTSFIEKAYKIASLDAAKAEPTFFISSHTKKTVTNNCNQTYKSAQTAKICCTRTEVLTVLFWVILHNQETNRSCKNK